MKNKLTISNTYNSGRMTFLILKEKKSYTGVCLEFDLTVQAPTLEEAKEHIEDLANGWLKNVRKNHLPESLLNNPAPKRYWDISETISKEIEANRTESKRATSLLSQNPTSVKSSLLFSIVQNYLSNNSLALR